MTHVNRIRQGDPKHLRLKRNLRSEMTPAENKLWLQLRSRQLQNLKFRRQHGIGPYVVDFYCPEKRLVIEVDGDVHAESYQVIKDQSRERELKKLGLQIIRYNNNDILKNVESVLEDLFRRLGESLPPLTPPYKGGKERRQKGD